MSLPLLLVNAAGAQGFDAHGPALAPDGDSVADPSFTFDPGPTRNPSFTLLGEGVSGVLVREVTDGPYARVEPVVDGLFGANLGGRVGLGRRASIAAALPVWLGVNGEVGTAPAIGDLVVWVPIHAAHGDRFGLDVVPFGRLPTGPGARYLGDPWGAGVRVASAARFGMLALHLDAEAEARATTGEPGWKGGLTGQIAGAVGLVPSEGFGVHAELRSRAPLTGGLVSVPSEAMLTLKGRPVPRLILSIAGGAAVTRGIGAAAPRFLFGGTVVLGALPDDDATEPGRVDARGEVKELHVVDDRRFPVQGATVTLGGTVLTSDGDGYVDLPLKWLGKDVPLVLQHPAYQDVDLGALDPAAPWWEVALVRRPVEVAVSVIGPDGEPLLTPGITLVQVEDTTAEPGPPAIDAVGVHRWELSPGTTWVATLTAKNMGGQARVIAIPPQRIEAIRVDVLLAWEVDPSTNLAITVVDGGGDAVEDAVVAVDGRDFGTTGPGGEVRIQGLPRGPHEITVRSPLFGDATVAQVEVDEDAALTAVLEWPAGAVVVRATRADGTPLDATVQFAGPASLPARQVGSDGQKMFVLRPGSWTLTLGADGMTSQEHTLLVDDQPGVERQILAVLTPANPVGTASLVVRAVDPAGMPLEAVQIAVDGVAAGQTDADGQLVLLGLDPGERSITAAGELLRPVETTVTLAEGRQVAPLALGWVDGVVDVEARVAGAPVDATITVAGERDVPATRTGADGVERLVLPPGTWDVTVTAPGEAPVTREIVVAADDPGRQALAVGFGRSPDGVGEPGTVAAGPVTAQRPTRITLEGPDGPVVGEVVLRGPEGPDGQAAVAVVAVDGVAEVLLPAGVWEGMAVVDGLPAAPVRIEVSETRKRPAPVDIPIEADAPPTLMIEDLGGAPVADAVVRVDGVEVGRTTEAGLVALDAPLPEGARTLTIEPATPGIGALDIGIEGASGRIVVAPDAAVQVPVTVQLTPDQAIAEARVTALGPAGQRVEVRTVADGPAEFGLTPGTWTLAVRHEGSVASAEIRVERGAPAAPVRLDLTAVDARITGKRIIPARQILFDLDSSEIRDELLLVIEDVARLMRADRTLALVEIAGHTDDQGGSAYNQTLSEDRAAAVRDALVARGVETERLVRRGYGLSRPATAGTDDLARQLNRRVELVIVEATP